MNGSPPRTETILIVDDQEQNLKVVGAVLGMTGYATVAARSGKEALECLTAQTPDLMLLDMLMPEMDGLEVCRLVKTDARWADLPVIFLSATDDKNQIVQALESGGVDYVTKPFNKAELLSRVRTHLTLKQARDQLRHLAEDKDELLGILTHDMKNHLNGIQLCATVLHKRKGEMPEECGKLAENIIRSSDAMGTFVEEFLSNQSAEHLHVQLVPLDLRSMLRQAARRHAPMATAKNITLKLKLSKKPVVVMADQGALMHVLDNLLTNAVKFSHPGSAIRLTCGAGPGDFIHFSVRDEGPGFTEEDKGKMFRRYVRLSARPIRGEPSTGLGLSIVKRLMDAMQGSIELESHAGKGACFTMCLPAATDPILPIT